MQNFRARLFQSQRRFYQGHFRRGIRKQFQVPIKGAKAVTGRIGEYQTSDIGFAVEYLDDQLQLDLFASRDINTSNAIDDFQLGFTADIFRCPAAGAADFIHRDKAQVRCRGRQVIDDLHPVEGGVGRCGGYGNAVGKLLTYRRFRLGNAFIQCGRQRAGQYHTDRLIEAIVLTLFGKTIGRYSVIVEGIVNRQGHTVAQRKTGTQGVICGDRVHQAQCFANRNGVDITVV